MGNIINELYQLEPSSLMYWIVAGLGLLLIIALGTVIKYIGNQLLSRKHTQVTWYRSVNLVTLCISMIFTLSYLSTAQWMSSSLFVLGNSEITPLLIVIVIFTLIIAYRLSRILRENILTRIYLRYNVEIGVQATINILLHYTIMLTVVFFALNSLGFNFASLTVFASVLGVGIGFGLRNIMNNFVSGLIILFDRPIKVGDRVIIDDTIVDIEKIRIRNTIGHTRKNERIVIPNSFFLEQKFINRSYSDRRLRITVGLSVPYGTDLDLATQLMKEAVIELSETKWQVTMHNPEPRVFIEEFSDYDVAMKVWFWIDDQENEYEFIVPSDARYLIYKKFNENSVEFSSPRQDVLIMNEKLRY